jgi:hypothetical protein
MNAWPGFPLRDPRSSGERWDLTDAEAAALRAALGHQSPTVRSELLWWMSNRGHILPGQKPDFGATSSIDPVGLVDEISLASREHNQPNWALTYYFLAAADEVPVPSQLDLADRATADIALQGLAPLPAWLWETQLGRALTYVGLRSSFGRRDLGDSPMWE